MKRGVAEMKRATEASVTGVRNVVQSSGGRQVLIVAQNVAAARLDARSSRTTNESQSNSVGLTPPRNTTGNVYTTVSTKRSVAVR